MYSSKQDLFYEQVDENLFKVMIRCDVYVGQPNPAAHLFSSWMADSIPSCTRIIQTRVDHFFGDGRYMLWMVNKSELVLIKLSHPIKTRDQWIEEYHNRTRDLMAKIKKDMHVLLSTGLMKAQENAWVDSIYPPKRLPCQTTPTS